jgi:hypothetical protein
LSGADPQAKAWENERKACKRLSISELLFQRLLFQEAPLIPEAPAIKRLSFQKLSISRGLYLKAHY